MGARMKQVASAIVLISQHDIASLEKNKVFSLLVDNEPVELLIGDVDIIAEDIPGWSVANKDNLTVALDITITAELQEEGNAREIVNKIQKIRKERGLEVTDRIIVNIQDFKTLKSAIISYSDYICTEILADAIHIVPEQTEGEEIEVNDVMINIFIYKTP
jgi:isoleucyl-tRNA synthetase